MYVCPQKIKIIKINFSKEINVVLNESHVFKSSFIIYLEFEWIINLSSKKNFTTLKFQINIRKSSIYHCYIVVIILLLN